MKKVVLIVFLISTVAIAQIERRVGDFTKVTAFDKIDVLLIPANENKVILTGSGAESVEVVLKNNELKLRMPITQLLSGDAVSATVYFTHLEAVETNEGSYLGCDSVVKSTSFEIIAKEGSKIRMNLEVYLLKARTANGSVVMVTGKAKNQDVIVNSGGIYQADRLITEQTMITGNAGGDALIYASELVDAKIRAGGTILIYGNPKQVNEKIIAGGTIRQIK